MRRFVGLKEMRARGRKDGGMNHGSLRPQESEVYRKPFVCRCRRGLRTCKSRVGDVAESKNTLGSTQLQIFDHCRTLSLLPDQKHETQSVQHGLRLEA